MVQKYMQPYAVVKRCVSTAEAFTQRTVAKGREKSLETNCKESCISLLTYKAALIEAHNAI